MTTRNSLLVAFLISTVLCFAQSGNWVNQLPLSANLPQLAATGRIHLDNNSFEIIKRNKRIELSYFGEPINEQVFEIDIPLGNLAVIREIYPREINNQDVSVLVINSPAGNKLFLATYTLEGELLGENFQTEAGTNVLDSGRKAIVIEAENQDLITFGPELIANYSLQNDYTWTETPLLEHDFQSISSAMKVGNSFFITTEIGKAVLLSADFQILWQYDTENPLESAIKTTNGYLLCGTNTTEETAYITKVDEQGMLVWQQGYEEKSAFSILAMNDNFLIGGIDIYSINNNGDLLWTRDLPKSEGIFQMAHDPYGGILLLELNKAYRLKIENQASFSQYNRLGVNNVEALISPWGNLDHDNGGGLHYPLGTDAATVFANAPIFTGQTTNGGLKGFYNTYNSNPQFTSLPQNGDITESKLWNIAQKEIDAIQQRLNDGESLEPYSNSMLTYPGKGNPNCIINGEAFDIEQELAPFVDVNNDGIYNMFDGDYPEMKGDRMIWWAQRDTVNELELHGRWYAYQCGDHIVSNTIYVDYEIVNISSENLTECRFGKFVDWDLGCYTDDFIGTLPNANSIYVYNADEIDGTNGAICDAGVSTYNDEIPVQSLTFLGEQMASSMYYINGNFGTPPPATTDPNSLLEANYFLQAQYRDGTPLTYGGSGYDPASMDFTDFVFPSNPSAPDGWSMASESLPLADTRSVAATAAFDLAAGDSKAFSFAFITHPNIPHPAPDVSSVEESILELSAIYDDGNVFAYLNLGEDVMIASGESITLDAGEEGQFYNWSTGETTSSITITAAGNYGVTLTDQTGCERSDEITISLTTGVETIPTADLLLMYPNPVQKGSTAYIQLAAAQQVSDMKLLNIVGQELFTQSLNRLTATIQIGATANLPTGIYIVQLSLMDGKSKVGKLIVE